MLKKTLILTLTICALASLATAQENWELIESPTVANLSSITFFTPEIGIITIGNGAILRTEDGGLNWVIVTGGSTQVTTSTLDGGRAVENYNSSRSNTTSISTGDGIIVGDGGIIVLTENSGLDWVSSPSGTLADLFDVDFLDSNTVIVV